MSQVAAIPNSVAAFVSGTVKNAEKPRDIVYVVLTDEERLAKLQKAHHQTNTELYIFFFLIILIIGGFFVALKL